MTCLNENKKEATDYFYLIRVDLLDSRKIRRSPFQTVPHEKKERGEEDKDRRKALPLKERKQIYMTPLTPNGLGWESARY